MSSKSTYVTLREAAASLGVHESTIRRYADRGLIGVARLPSGVRRLRRIDVEALRHPAGTTNQAVEARSAVTIAMLAAEQGAGPLASAAELEDPELWTSDAEVDLFNATVRAERDRDR